MNVGKIVPETRWCAPGGQAVLCNMHAETEWKRYSKSGWMQVPDHHLGAYIEGTGSPLPCDFCGDEETEGAV